MGNTPFISARQVALFPKEFRMVNANAIIQKLMEIKEYDAVPTMIPISNTEDETNISTLIELKSKDGSRSVQITNEKIDLFWSNKGSEVRITKEEITQQVKYIINALALSPIKRIGFITELAIPTTNFSDTVDKIKDNILISNKCEDLTNYYLRLSYNIRMKSTDKRCNKVIDILNGMSTADPTKPVIIVKVDINTNQKITADFDPDKVENFIDEAFNKEKPEIVMSNLWQTN